MIISKQLAFLAMAATFAAVIALRGDGATAAKQSHSSALGNRQLQETPEWLWLACGRGRGLCGGADDIAVPSTTRHEVRCCATRDLGWGWMRNGGTACRGTWHESNLRHFDGGSKRCFHASTYEEATAICAANNAEVCSKQQVENGCVKGSGCEHDNDLIWTSDEAPPRALLPTQEPKDPEDYLWLSCGRGTGLCGATSEYKAQAKERHEVRCCSDYPVDPDWEKNAGCSIWTQSDLMNDSGHFQCFHHETYEKAQAICASNGGYVCTKEQVENGCTAGSGCSHDNDLVWTSTDATPAEEPVVFPNTDEVDPEDWIYLACGRGRHLCGIGIDIQIRADETAELRCCSPVPVSGWKRNDGCDTWHESDLLNSDGHQQCFHDVTYAEGQEICARNGGHVCTKEQIESGCARGSGCGHDGDLIWTGAPAPSRAPSTLPYQDPVDPADWLWLACGRGGYRCGIDDEIQAQASEGHEVRCCSDYPLPGWSRKTTCDNWHQSRLVDLNENPGTCFHNSTYAEAQQICLANGGYVCTRSQVEAGCAKGSGCGHDEDLIWTSNPAPPRPTVPEPVAVPDDTHLFLACGAGENGCNGEPVGIARATDRHEVRCCTPYPQQGWLKGRGDCGNYHESDLMALDGTPDQCFYSSTYAEAQAICHANNAYVCSSTEVLNQCARGSGCGHDGDLIWTSTEATAEAIAEYNAKATQAAAISSVCVGGATGRVSGDPHFTTFDNYKYDCQGHGEFVIAMSTGSDPLAIHGRFVRVTDSKLKPTITRSVAIKVVDEVPTIQVTAPPQKINGKCPFTFTMGEAETVIPADEIISFLDTNYNGKVYAFTNGKNIILTFPSALARIQITGGGGGSRCVLNTNLCLTPESHGGAANIVGLLGSPDGDTDNDWMNRDGTITSQPDICEVPNPTNSEVKHCRREKNTLGHEWCMDNWCVGHANNSLWGEESHAEYNECENRQPDTFFEDVEDADPAITEACEDAEDVDGCIMDTIICVEDGGTIQECADIILDEDTIGNFTETIGDRDPTDQLDDWDGPNFNETESVPLAPEETPNPPVPSPTPDRTESTTSNGDPHFRTWKDEHFEFHGQCDVVMMSVSNFANLGVDLDIHLRTKMIRFWSYIKTAAIRIGNDVLEVEGSAIKEDGDMKLHYWTNYEYRGELEDLAGFPVTVSDRRNKYTIDFGSVYPGLKIVINTFKEFVGVKVIGATEDSFGESVGMTGNFKSGKTLARDGVTEIHDYNEYGQEWQVLPSDGRLFHEFGYPTFPQHCLIPEDSRGERRRRLAESDITEEAAEAACAGLEDAIDRKDCVYDILATQDLDMVGAY